MTGSRRLAAIMFTDMVGYSAMVQADEEGSIEALERHNRALRPIFAKFHGREVKTIGDAFLVEFGSALEAVRCALEMQSHLRTASLTGGGGRPVQIRIGIHVGDVVEDNGDVLGDAVNIASRIEPLATPGGICLSQQVYDRVQNKVASTFVKLPRPSLKNLGALTEVYRVVAGAAPAPVPAARPGGPGEKHLAVLPLANVSDDGQDEYFADGLTDELISVLSRIHGLSVIARSSVMPYKRDPKPISAVGTELGVEVVLEGSVRKWGNRVRVTLQLVEAATQRHLWAGSMDRDLDDVFAVQAYVASRAARALRLTLAKDRRTGPRASSRPNPRWGVTTGGDAYDAYLRGLAASRLNGGQGLDEAFRWFETATRLDPELAEAYAAWANVYTTAAGDYFPMREGMPRAKELAARAVELDPNCSDAHASLGNIALQFDNDWGLAESEFLHALDLNPSNIVASRFYGTLLTTLGRLEEAKEAFRHALRLDPVGMHPIQLAWAEVESGEMEAALATLELVRGRGTHPHRHPWMLPLCLLAAGRREDALRAFARTVPPEDDDERFDAALVGALLGRVAPAREIVEEYERGASRSYTSPAHAGMMYAALHEHDRALELMERDLREGDHVLWLYYRHPAFDTVRGDPRFLAMTREMAIPILPIRDWVPPAESP